MSKTKIAITGGIGSGKSTVGKLLREKGYAFYSCDEISRELFQEADYQALLLKSFPNCESSGKIDKNKLSAIVFNDRESLEKLNGLAHPRIMQRLIDCMEKEEQSIVFAEVPLLFEGDYCDLFDFVIVVERDLDLRIQAVLKRDRRSKEEVRERTRNQWDYHSIEHEELMKNSKFFRLKNNRTQTELESELEKFLSIMKHYS